MPTAGQLPRGLNKDYKDQLLPLVDDGWCILRSRKGHLKLTHPDTPQVVIGASTPSDFRSALNLKSQCRSALRNGSAITPIVQPICEADCKDTLRMHKRARKPKPGHSLARKPLTNPLFASLQLPEVTVKTAPADQFDNAEPVQKAPALAQTVVKLVVKSPRKTPVLEAPKAVAPVAPPAPVVPKAPVVEKPTLAADMRRVPADIFDLVMGIVSGEVAAFTVTPEMVGARIAVKDGVMYLIEAGGVAPLTMTAPGALTGACAAKPHVAISPDMKSDFSGVLRREEMQDNILKILKQFGEAMTARDLVTLMPEHLKSDSDSSTWTRVGQCCANLMKAGLANRKKGAKNRFVYSAIAA